MLGIEEGEPSSCGGAPRGVALGGHKILSPPCVLRSQNLPMATHLAVAPRLGYFLLELIIYLYSVRGIAYDSRHFALAISGNKSGMTSV